MVVTDNNTTLNTVHHPHYRIVLKETGNWKPLLEADRLSQVAVMLDDLVQGEAFKTFDDVQVDLSA